MAVDKPIKVEKKNITSTDIVSFNGGLDERGDANAEPNTFVYGRNVMVNLAGLLTHRFGLKKWLPDTVDPCYEVFPAIYDGNTYNIVADDDKIKYCQTGDTAWTDCGGDNTIVVPAGTITTFLRVQDRLLILNGVTKIAYIDLSDMTVVKFALVTDPTTQPTITSVAPSTLALSGTPIIYYATNWNSIVGQTALSPIRTQNISKSRGTWADDGTNSLTINRVNTPPANAVSWNLWIALAKSGATIQPSDMLLLAGGIDLDSATIVDNGTLPIDISRGTAPEDNSTDGMIASYGVEDKGRPILYGDPEHPHNLYIGGDGENALDFSPTNGGYVVEMNKGTNYYPQGVIGFRNGQGIPSMTVLFSNTTGLSKQTIIEQQTVTYGNQSFVIWTQTEQNYGAAGVSSPYAVINYLGKLIFPTTDGIVSMDTQASMQNVLSSKRISDKASRTVGSIKNSSLPLIVGTAWSNRVLMSVPSRGYSFNNEILVYDMTNDQKPTWYTLDVRAQWIGTISPRQEAAFIYVCQDNHIFRLEQSYVALDENADGTTTPFPVSAKGALIGTNQAHNGFVSVVQVMFYLIDFIGEIEIGVTYRNEVGKMKTKSRFISRGAYAKSSGGGWSSPPYTFQANSTYLRWGEFPDIADAELANKDTIREPLVLNVLTSEMQFFINTNLDNSSFILRSVSYEGINIGVRGDLR